MSGLKEESRIFPSSKLKMCLVSSRYSAQNVSDLLFNQSSSSTLLRKFSVFPKYFLTALKGKIFAWNGSKSFSISRKTFW
jgi:hypothetical protein